MARMKGLDFDNNSALKRCHFKVVLLTRPNLKAETAQTLPSYVMSTAS